MHSKFQSFVEREKEMTYFTNMISGSKYHDMNVVYRGTRDQIHTSFFQFLSTLDERRTMSLAAARSEGT